MSSVQEVNAQEVDAKEVVAISELANIRWDNKNLLITKS